MAEAQTSTFHSLQASVWHWWLGKKCPVGTQPVAKDYRSEGQNVTKSRLIQAIIMTLLPGLFFTYCLITCAVFCFKLSFILNSLHCFLMFVFLFFDT